MDASEHPEPSRRGATKVRVLVAFEDARGVYGEAIARALAELRPDLQVRRAPLAEIGRELRDFDPHVVVCSETDDGHPSGRGAWVQVPTDDGADGRLAHLCLEGEHWATEGPTLGEIRGRRRYSAGACAKGAWPGRVEGLLLLFTVRPRRLILQSPHQDPAWIDA